MKKLLVTGAIVISSMISFSTMAQMSDDDAAAAVKRRQSVFQLLSFANGPLGQMARGNMDFDKDAAMLGLERIKVLAPMIPELFAAADTRKNMGLTTRAADTIWDNQADFAKLAQDLVDGADAAMGILESQGAGGVRQAVGQVGPKCGACHDRFRLD